MLYDRSHKYQEELEVPLSRGCLVGTDSLTHIPSDVGSSAYPLSYEPCSREICQRVTG